MTNKTYGVYTYQVLLSNSAGTTASDPVSYADGGASNITLSGNSADVGRQSLEITINQGNNDFTLGDVGAANPTFSLITNNSSVISYQMLNSTTLRIDGLKAGRSSLRITENSTGDIRYIYINGGPTNGWRTWTSVDGGRAISYVRNSLQMGMIPFFVYYNIPDSSESYTVDKQHINDPTYMQAYFKDLQFFLSLGNLVLERGPLE